MQKPQHDFGNNASQAERQQREAEEAARQVWDSHVSDFIISSDSEFITYRYICFLSRFSVFCQQLATVWRWRRRKGKQRKLPGMPTQTFSSEICIRKR